MKIKKTTQEIIEKLNEIDDIKEIDKFVFIILTNPCFTDSLTQNLMFLTNKKSQKKLLDKIREIAIKCVELSDIMIDIENYKE